MTYQFLRKQSYFAYSNHKTLHEAEDALDTYFTTGEVCEAESPYVAKKGDRFAVMFPAT